MVGSPVSLGPDEQHRRRCDRIVEALVACGATEGLPRTALKWLAFGGDVVPAYEYTAALTDLVAANRIEARDVDHFVGRGGSGCRIYRLTVHTADADCASQD
jgi:hypothetical protein